MIDLLIWIAVIVVSLAVLIKSAGYFTDAAEKLGLHFGIAPFVVGVTIVSIGTSLPELVSAVLSVTKGSSEIVTGMVVGSNISNILLVLGVAAVVSRKAIGISYDVFKFDMPVLLGSAVLLGIFIWNRGFGPIEAVVSLVLGIGFLYVTTRNRHGVAEKEFKHLKKRRLGWRVPMKLVLGAVFIYLAAKYVIDAVVMLSQILDIGTELIAVSAVAIGTSLPELTVSVTAALKGETAIAVGNVVGSNIFNSFFVMGVPALFGVLTVTDRIVTFALPVMIIATFLLFFMARDKKIMRWEGVVLIAFYLIFMGRLFYLF